MEKNNIRSLRNAAGLTLEQLAERAGTSFAQIQKLETGERRLTLSWMKRIAKSLHCTPSDLISDEQSPKHQNNNSIQESEIAISYMTKAVIQLLIQHNILSPKGLDVILNHAIAHYQKHRLLHAAKVIEGFRMIPTDELTAGEGEVIHKLLQLVPLGSA